ncbi:MAG: AtzE family amidohydrolase [Herminiimonas sp.]|nr:AtzE family amidohydrolase [Herminiimonas sp.]MDB5855544.1 AtzE family amidohydrolase [Herminiimonas sp.]
MTVGAVQIAKRIAEGEVTAVQVLEQAAARIEKLDGEINCFTTLTLARARQEAAAIDALRAAGAPLPALAGVPYAVKNLFDVEDEVTLSGGKVNSANPPASADALLVSRMRAAGAVLVGMLNMDEHAYGFTTENTHYGATKNPHDTRRIAGGSSGGSAAAVAAGLVPITLGSDTNGSIRVPSSLCGIFGLKPTYGRLPSRGTYPFVTSLDHLGPFAASVGDLALVYDALMTPGKSEKGNAQRATGPLPGGAHAVFGKRIAVLGGWFKDCAGPAAQDAVRRVAQALGATVTVEWASAEQARAAAFMVTGSEGGALHRARLVTRYDEYEPLSRDRLVAGSLIPASWVVQAQRVREQALRQVMTLFRDYDLLIAPSTPVTAPLIGTEELLINGRRYPARASMGLLTQPISCVGLPVCAVPVWDTEGAEGLPIGVQLIAAPWREDICLAAGRLLEAADVAKCRTPGQKAFATGSRSMPSQ